MVSEKDLRDIIAQVLTEMNVGQDGGSAASSGSAAKADCQTTIEDGCWDDVAAVDLRTQYLVENPVNRDAYYDLKQYAPCRLGIGKAGARYKTCLLYTSPSPRDS